MLAQQIAASTASVGQILEAANYYLSIEGDDDMAWAYREGVAIRVIREEVDVGEAEEGRICGAESSVLPG